MHDDLAIQIDNVSKVYRLYGSQKRQLLHVMGLERLAGKSTAKEFQALKNVSLHVSKSQRVGVVGRNGAGKTTLLKLICGNFAPTSGDIKVNGDVQALMGVGLGFHPEYTGRENVLASLQYNGLSRDEYVDALNDIVEFCELGDFLDQPFRTYSLGMQARLMFATSTAVQPDILIVDEVLGAGDAYFVAKSRRRMEALVKGGCTMLLVSHSTSQILELCDRAIWLDQGQVRMEGEAFLVVKAYEEFIHGRPPAVEGSPAPQLPQELAVSMEVPGASTRYGEGSAHRLLQEPAFQPHHDVAHFKPIAPHMYDRFDFVARGGLSRWQSEVGLKISGFTIQAETGPTNVLTSLRAAQFVLSLKAELTQDFECRYGILVHDHQGRCVVRLLGPRDAFSIKRDETRTIKVELNPLQLGPGDYTIGISVLEYTPLELINSARRYDLLARSFEFTVVLPESLAASACEFFHSAEWHFHPGEAHERG